MVGTVESYAQNVVTPPRNDQPRKADKNQDPVAALFAKPVAGNDAEQKTQTTKTAAADNAGASSQQASRGRGSVIDITV